MSFEIGNESRAFIPRRRVGTREIDRFPGLGATAVQTIIANTTASAATAPWMVGLPKAGDSKDNTRIAYAKRDHDLALSGDATAYANLKSQAVGSATSVGKAWYNAALNDVNRSRIVAATPATRTAPPPTLLPGVTKVPFNPAVLLIDPIVKQATDMGLKVQQTSDGSVVAVNSAGAVVSKPLPVSPSAVTDTAIVPTNAVQANAPPPRTRAPSSGILSILDKLQQATTAPANTSSDNFVASQGAPAAAAPAAAPSTANTADMTGGGGAALGDMLSNPVVLIALAVGGYLLFATGSPGRKR